MFRIRHLVPVLLVMVGLLGVGCTSVPKNGDLKLVRADSDQPRAGNVYLLRGWIGIFSRGVDDLGAKMQAEGIRAQVYQADQWSELARTIAAKYTSPTAQTRREPLVLVGHSYGADNVVRIANELKARNVTVDLLITLDPVTPPSVPTNVARAYNLYQSNGVADALPWLRGIPLKAEAASVPLQNVNVRTDRTDLLDGHVDHFNIEKKASIHKEVIRQVETVCLPRAQWAALHNRQNNGWAGTPAGSSGGAQMAADRQEPVSRTGGRASVQPVSGSGSAAGPASGTVIKAVSAGPWSTGGQ